MANTISFCIGMLLVVGSAGAETYRCTDAAGNTVFTDAPAAYSGCETIRVQEPPTIPVTLPGNQSTSTDSPGVLEPPVAIVPPEPAQGMANEDFAYFMGEATALVAEFKNSQKLAINAQFHRDKIEARRNLGDIRQRKNQLLEKLKSAGLSVAEDEEIQQTLSAITAEE